MSSIETFRVPRLDCLTNDCRPISLTQILFTQSIESGGGNVRLE